MTGLVSKDARDVGIFTILFTYISSTKNLHYFLSLLARIISSSTVPKIEFVALFSKGLDQ